MRMTTSDTRREIGIAFKRFGHESFVPWSPSEVENQGPLEINAENIPCQQAVTQTHVDYPIAYYIGTRDALRICVEQLFPSDGVLFPEFFSIRMCNIRDTSHKTVLLT